MSTIPISQIVSISPSVLAAGGAGISFNGLMLTQSPRVPIGAVVSFATAANVASYFGASSTEYALASTYFLGYSTGTQTPSALLFAQYPAAPVAGYLRGGSGLTLSAVQAMSGNLTVTIDGAVKTASSISLSAATSFSSAAALIQSGLGITGTTGAVVTGSITTTTLTVTAVTSGALVVGQALSGTGVTAGTTITAFGTGTGGTGTYTVSVSQTVASGTITATNPAVVYDSVSGSFVIYSGTTGASSSVSFATGTLAAPLLLTQSTGAVASAGAVAATPVAFMTNLVTVSQAWTCFTTTWEPATADCVSFAQWTNGTDQRYAYIMWDTDAAPTVTGDTTSAGYQIIQADYSGTVPIYEPDATIATFVLGTAASIDTTATNGRITFAFRSQSGITPSVTNASIAANLIANGYNYYGAYAEATEAFDFFYPGSMTGQYLWLDSFLDQVWLNSQLRVALATLLTNVNSIPYNSAGYTLIREACKTPITAGLNFGAIRAGVTLSSLQAAEVDNAAGVTISPTLSTAGYYLLINDASATTRAARQSPPMTLWYMDGESVQAINLASILVQ
jgi:hypothetical protein